MPEGNEVLSPRVVLKSSGKRGRWTEGKKSNKLLSQSAPAATEIITRQLHAFNALPGKLAIYCQFDLGVFDTNAQAVAASWGDRTVVKAAGILLASLVGGLEQ
jgi:hypothetical protein